jgi:hypothetical protein
MTIGTGTGDIGVTEADTEPVAGRGVTGITLRRGRNMVARFTCCQ